MSTMKEGMIDSLVLSKHTHTLAQTWLTSTAPMIGFFFGEEVMVWSSD